ncbi:MAG: hypothetical protein ACREI8_01155 [Myxococcota bacterium]
MPPAVLYVEGPRDRDILEGWAHAASAPLARAVREAAVILGGRQPGRAAAHFAEQSAARPGLVGICVLDRDGGSSPAGASRAGDLEVFTWSRRHIESYLLVPAAIQRSLRAIDDERRVARLLRQHLPAWDDERTLRDLDAKRLLASHGPLARGIGQPFALGRIARVMRPDELHADVTALLERLHGALLGPAATVTAGTSFRAS